MAHTSSCGSPSTPRGWEGGCPFQNVICLRRLGQDPSSRTLGKPRGKRENKGRQKALQGCSSHKEGLCLVASDTCVAAFTLHQSNVYFNIDSP